jgi:hypothetical protein
MIKFMDRNCFGGGVLVYTADYLHVLRRNDLEFNGGELIWLEVIFPRFKILVCAVYRSVPYMNRELRKAIYKKTNAIKK